MKRLYQNTFDQVQLPEQAAERMRRHLQAASSRKEVISMKKRLWRVVPIAAVLVIALTCTAFAYGEQLLAQIQMLTGGTVTVGTDEDGNEFIQAEITGDNSAPVEIEDGRIYFVHGDTREDITDQCGEDRYFSYEETAEDGTRQVIAIGGTPEHVGYVNFVWLSDDATATTSEADDAPWLRQAYEDYGVEWIDTLETETLDDTSEPPYQVQDGRIYFTLDGSGLDITDQCGEDCWYTYETTGEDGSRQITLVGGTPESVGYLQIEFSGDEYDTVSVNNCAGEAIAWADAALEEYGLEELIEQ